MPTYKEKACDLCFKEYCPTSPKQRYCPSCIPKGKKVLQSTLDSKKNRLKHPTLLIKQCKACLVEFKTYYPHKDYCGSKECEKIRVYIKNQNGHAKRDKGLLNKKGKQYYNDNKEKCLLHKAVQYRKDNPNAKEYMPGKLSILDYSFVEQYLKDNGYELLSNEYINNNTKLLVKCPSNHKWLTTFHRFKDAGCRCAVCYQQNNYVSKPEQLIRDFISKELPDIEVIYNDRSIIAPKELDFYFPKHNLAIEICGLHWHGELSSGKRKDYHYEKMMACYTKGIRLITVFEDELINYLNVVTSRIRQALGIPERRIFARKCLVMALDSKTTNDFFIRNHIQGKSNALVRYGLFYQEELVCVGSLGVIGRKHTSSEDTLELKRFCTLSGVSVVGGVGKLFKVMKEFAKINGYKVIKSYCDMRYANIFNPVYEVLGFELDSFTKYTPHYIKQGKRYRNMSLRKTPEERLTGKTEWELRQEQGYDRIWDCGHRTYTYLIK